VWVKRMVWVTMPIGCEGEDGNLFVKSVVTVNESVNDTQAVTSLIAYGFKYILSSKEGK